jgi:hypothetical protein
MSILHQGEMELPYDEPLDSVIIEDPLGLLKKEPAMTEVGVATIKGGHMVANTHVTYANGCALAPALHGKTAEVNEAYVAEIPRQSINLDGNWNKDDAYPASCPFDRYKIYDGLKFWAKCDNKTFTAEALLCHAANGLLDAIGDPDGETHAVNAFTYKVLKAVTTKNWVPVVAKGKQMFDNTA